MVPGSLARLAGCVLLVVLGSACASEEHRTVEPNVVATYETPFSGTRYPLVIGKFANSSQYNRGLFTEGPDKLASQAKTILQTHLTATNRFTLLDRDNLDELQRESGLTGEAQALAGAKYVVTGEVTEFGRRTTGDRWFFGLFGRGKTQTAYAKVSLNVVDVTTSAVVYAVQGGGEYELSNREILGTGGTSGYDSTLNGKVLDFAIVDAVNHLVEGLEQGAWSVAP
ncbi:MAG: CsgG/HfaB family protein [Planctomycetes bacterium]|nr:CsgG/HfaB family protein [Planctomycetota bacterium]